MAHKVYNYPQEYICERRFDDVIRNYGPENYVPICETSGTPYPCNIEDGRYLQDSLATPNRFPDTMTTKEAAYRLYDIHLKEAETERQSAALSRLERLEYLNDADNWGPDIIYKVFHDMDDGLFGGNLREHVSLFWDKNKPGESTFETLTGPGKRYRQEEGGRIRIVMFADTLLLNPEMTLEDLVVYLGYGMIQAWMLLYTGNLLDKKDPTHGKLFRGCVRAIDHTLRRWLDIRIPDPCECNECNYGLTQELA